MDPPQDDRSSDVIQRLPSLAAILRTDEKLQEPHQPPHRASVQAAVQTEEPTTLDDAPDPTTTQDDTALENGLSKGAIVYLATVYSCVAVTVASATLGVLADDSSGEDEKNEINAQGSTVFGLVLLMMIYVLKPTTVLLPVRISLLALFAYLEGKTLKDGLELGTMNDTEFLAASLAGSTVVFGGVSLAALAHSPNPDSDTTGIPAAALIRKLSYIAIVLLSATLLESSIPGFIGQWVFGAAPYISLVISSSFVLVDTQMLIVRAVTFSAKDPVKDAIMIFLDSVDVFRKTATVCKRRMLNARAAQAFVSPYNVFSWLWRKNA
ncbi:unnamed protein product [Notodromas monacha]|uniref:Uncharacterized protein n=1 Tax=Notodromas monacha TaxID=399045 RepID=A0A7R9BM12_9CRUS|nr:unnamed protein product [Notodromas monacha]CAG0917968.1 unnamed protein product [Notodromas monacha]